MSVSELKGVLDHLTTSTIFSGKRKYQDDTTRVSHMIGECVNAYSHPAGTAGGPTTACA